MASATQSRGSGRGGICVIVSASMFDALTEAQIVFLRLAAMRNGYENTTTNRTGRALRKLGFVHIDPTRTRVMYVATDDGLAKLREIGRAQFTKAVKE